MKRHPITPVRIEPNEKAELDALAARAGITLSEALRVGGRRYLEELTGRRIRATPTRTRVRR